MTGKYYGNILSIENGDEISFNLIHLFMLNFIIKWILLSSFYIINDIKNE